MTAKIYIASKPVIFGYEHLYLVYDPGDGSEHQVIRGGPDDSIAPFGKIVIEDGFNISNSEDDLGSDTQADRNYTELSISGNATTVWSEMIDFVRSMAQLDGQGNIIRDTADNNQVKTIYDYDAVAVEKSNSNSIIASALASQGIKLEDQTPKLGGTGTRIDISTFPGSEVIYGGDENDDLTIGDDVSYVNSNDGDDTVYGHDLATEYHLGEGNDTVFAGGGNDEIYGGIGNDFLAGQDGDDILHGGSGNDSLLGEAGNDTYYYQSGQDTITETSGWDDAVIFDSSIDRDTVKLIRNGNSLKIETDSSNYIENSSQFFSSDFEIERASFDGGSENWYFRTQTDGDDTYTGTTLDDVIFGLEGNDTLSGGAGEDILIDHIGNNTLQGGTGDDTYYHFEDDTGIKTIYDSSGTDNILVDDSDAIGTKYRDGSDLLLWNGTRDHVRVVDHFSGNGVENISYTTHGFTTDLTSLGYTTNIGTSGNDHILYAGSNRYVDGLGGNDTIRGGNNADILRGGAGDDNIQGFGFSDILYGESGDDTLNAGVNSIKAGTVVYDGSGNDTVLYTATAVYNYEENIGYDDYFQTGNTLEFEILSGNFSNAVRYDLVKFQQALDAGPINYDHEFNSFGLTITYYTDLEVYVDGELTNINLAPSDDEFTLAKNGSISGNLTSDNGNGEDLIVTGTLSVQATSFTTSNGGNVTINSDGSYSYNAAIDFTGIDSFTYTALDGLGSSITATATFNVVDATNGTGSNETINGSSSADIIYGLGGNDFIRGNSGNDIIYGGDGNDSLYGDAGTDFIYGEAGNDTFVSKAGNTYFDGGTDFDSANYTVLGFAGGINANLDTGLVTKSDGSTDTLVNVDRLLATAYDDTIQGGDAGETIEGRQGNDTIYGGAGNDFLYGNEGNDFIDGEGGFDTIKGGDGNDTIHGGDENDSLWGEAGNDNLYGYAGNDTLVGSLGNDIFYGGAGTNIANYSVLGGSITVDMDASSNQVSKYDGSNDDLTDVQIVYGTNHNDTLSGGYNINRQGRGGNDTITGGTGADYLYGNDGDDTLHGAGYNDRLYGGSGDDTFIFNRGGGSDNIVNDDSTSTDDMVDFGMSGTPIDHDQLWFEQSGNHLLVSVIGTNDTVTLENWYTTGYTVDSFESTDGYSLSSADVSTLVTAMALETKPSLGQTDMPTTTYNNLSAELAAAWV